MGRASVAHRWCMSVGAGEGIEMAQTPEAKTGYGFATSGVTGLFTTLAHSLGVTNSAP